MWNLVLVVGAFFGPPSVACGSSMRWNVFMTAVVSPLSALVKMISLFLLKLWLACPSYLLRLGVGLASYGL